MAFLDRMLCGAFDALFAPLRGLPPLASLAIVSLLTAIALLLVIRATSNQERIAAAKRRIWAGLFEIRLFNDDPRAILSAQGEILRHNLTYLRLSMVPMLWVLVPMVLLIAQLQSFYGSTALRPGDSFVLEADLAPALAGAPRPDARLQVPAGLRDESEEVWVPSLSQLAWRLHAERPGRYVLEVAMGAETFAKSVSVSTGGLERVSPERRRGFFNALLYPSEPPLADAAGVRGLRVTYPARDIAMLGVHLPWMVVYFVLVTVFALALKNRFRVTF